MSFSHLHLHTSYSLLDGSGRIPEMVKRVKELGQNAAAITDHGVMYGCIEFYKECKKQGIKPIIGCEVYVSPGSRFDREVSKGEDKYNHLILLAKNDEGYHNLIKIVSSGFLDGFYYKPRVDYEILEKYHEGLISLSACLAGEIPKLIVNNKYEEAKNAAKKLDAIFGHGNFFLELQNHGIDNQNTVNIALLRMSKELDIDLVATNDVHYTLKEDVDAHDALLCVQTGKKLSDTDRLRYEGGQFYIKSEEEMRELFPFALQAIDNTQKIVDMCNVEILFTDDTHKYHLPIFKTPNGETSLDYLKKLTSEGLKNRYKTIDDNLIQRLNYELNTIINMGFVDYFLIVQDYINYAKSIGIPVGPGRGSAAGSLVAYTLGITDVDPIKYNLLFERFLNPERVTMPDIDVDFCEERRGEVIDYVSNKYGKNNVSQIITFGTLKAKAVFKDVARVLDIPYQKSNEISKLIPRRVTKDGNTSLNVTYDDVLNADINCFDLKDQLNVLEFRKNYRYDTEVRKTVDLGMRLEGIPRNASMHASGVLIAPSPIYDFVSLVRLNDNKGNSNVVAGENMTTLEKLGLLKMDFLGLRNLTAIKETIDLVKKNYGKDINFSTCDYNDKKVFETISKGDTVGIFQLESPGMTNFMKDLKPTCLEDIIAGISLYRPGPMDFIPKYVDGKNNQKSIKYDCPQLEPILKSTYGCIVYQEQVMEIFRTLAGYSFGGADLVRRAMSKKHADELNNERRAFIFGDEKRGIKGCVLNGISDTIASKIFDDVMGFASYAFNKSHAAAYAHVAYQTAYLKVYYPVEFICALCNSVISKREELFPYIKYAKATGINILPPNVNKSFANYTQYNNEMLMGFAGLKGVANNLSDIIIQEREENGEYKSFYDFIIRLKDKGINKTAIESLILSGAFDSFYGNRKQKMMVYPLILKNDQSKNGKILEGQMSFMDFSIDNNENKKTISDNIDKDLIDDYKNELDFSKDEIGQYEREITGLYLTTHPLDDYKNFIKKMTNANTLSFDYDEENERSYIEEYIDKKIKIAGLISYINIKLTKKGDKMANIILEDEFGEIECLVFPKIFETANRFLNKNAKVYLEGHPDVVENGKSKLLIDKICLLENKCKKIIVSFNNIDDYKNNYNNFINICKMNEGENEVEIVILSDKLKKVLDNVLVNASDDLIKKMKEIQINANLEDTR